MLVWSGASVTVLVGHYLAIAAVFSTWPSDSFHTLSVKQQTGLATWSVLLIAALIWFFNKKTSWIFRLGRTYDVSSVFACVVDLIVTTLLFVLFYSASPQLYYLYYQLVIPGLPSQWIINPLHDFGLSTERLLIHPVSNYSDLLAVLTFWTLLCSIIWRHLLARSKNFSWAQPAVIGIGFGLMSLVWNSKY